MPSWHSVRTTKQKQLSEPALFAAIHQCLPLFGAIPGVIGAIPGRVPNAGWPGSFGLVSWNASFGPAVGRGPR
jgi:hypothetical protein